MTVLALQEETPLSSRIDTHGMSSNHCFDVDDEMLFDDNGRAKDRLFILLQWILNRFKRLLSFFLIISSSIRRIG